MRRRYRIIPLTLVAIVAGWTPLHAQDIDVVTRAKLGTLLEAAPTPQGKGLVPTALAEARTVTAQAKLAADAPTNLEAMRTAATGVLHAVDPALTKAGPGLGYGLTRALTEIVREVELTAAADGKRDIAVATPKALAAARDALATTAALVTVAQQIRTAPTAVVAAPLTKTLATLASQLVAGPTGTVQKGAPVGGLLGVQAHLGNLLASRDKALPAVLREEKPR